MLIYFSACFVCICNQEEYYKAAFSKSHPDIIFGYLSSEMKENIAMTVTRSVKG